MLFAISFLLLVILPGFIIADTVYQHCIKPNKK